MKDKILRLNASGSEPDLRRVSYRWSQVSPTQPNLLRDLNTRQAELNIDIPDDFVAADADEVPLLCCKWKSVPMGGNCST